MPLNIRFDGDVAVLSNFARLMNDPRYVDAARDLDDLLDQGARQFVIDLTGVRETGASFLGLLMTLTRRIRQAEGGEAVLAHPSREMEAFLLDEMQMDEYWDVFPSVQEAVEFHRPRTG
jgi:anti-sigma B factor antagonist